MNNKKNQENNTTSLKANANNFEINTLVSTNFTRQPKNLQVVKSNVIKKVSKPQNGVNRKG